MIPYEDFALDSGTGALVLFPQDHDEPYVLNTDLASFVRFLCLLEEERPHYDADFDPDEGEEGGGRSGLRGRRPPPGRADA